MYLHDSTLQVNLNEIRSSGIRVSFREKVRHVIEKSVKLKKNSIEKSVYRQKACKIKKTRSVHVAPFASVLNS